MSNKREAKDAKEVDEILKRVVKKEKLVKYPNVQMKPTADKPKK